MKEYVADQKIGKALYRRVKKSYKRYTYGMLVFACIVLIMLICNASLLMRAEDASQIPEIMIFVLGEDGLFFIALALVRALAISGGRKALLSRLAEKCYFTDASFILEYVPRPTETTEYELIQFEFEYRNIQKVVDEDRLGRLALYGTYNVFKYRTSFAKGDADWCTISDMPLYVYAYYEEFDEIKSRMSNVARDFQTAE